MRMHGCRDDAAVIVGGGRGVCWRGEGKRRRLAGWSSHLVEVIAAVRGGLVVQRGRRNAAVGPFASQLQLPLKLRRAWSASLAGYARSLRALRSQRGRGSGPRCGWKRLARRQWVVLLGNGRRRLDRGRRCRRRLSSKSKVGGGALAEIVRIALIVIGGCDRRRGVGGVIIRLLKIQAELLNDVLV